MAPKRPPPDPSASSSSEAEENDSEEEEEDDSDSESEKLDQPIDRNPPTQITKSESKSNPLQSPPKTQPSSKSNPVQSIPDAGTDSDSGSDSESDHHVRPVSSKPMEAVSPSKKPRSKQPRPESETPVKPLDTKDKASRSKRAKKKVSESESEDASKKPKDDNTKFQRLWSEEDEIAILKGILDYEAKKGSYPGTDMSAFHDFIKKSLQVEASKSQLVDKVRRLKKKYEINVGKNLVFSKPHEEKAFELSKKIWGVEKNGPREQTNPDGEVSKKNSKVSEAKTVVSPRKEPSSVVGNGGKKDSKSGFVIDWSKSKCLSESCEAVIGLREDEVKVGLELAGAEKYLALEMRWAKVEAKETEAYLERVAVLRDQTRLVLESLKAKRQ